VLGDYLVSVSKSIVTDQRARATTASKAARNRLDLLLVVNDVLHTNRYHYSSSADHGMFSKAATPFISELVELAASCIYERGSRFEAKLKAILNYWAVNKLIDDESFKSFRERVDESLMIAQGGVPVRKRNYLLPDFHGDKTAPWYELPASYMLDQMIEQPNRPIDPYRIKVARLDKKPVSSHVRTLLDNYFETIDLKYTPTGDNPSSETEKYNLWLDPMGQLVKQDKETGDTATVCNGYGWSMKFCQDMQKDGVPESIRKAREDAEQAKATKSRVGMAEKRRDERDYSRSPQRRRRSPSHSPRGRDRSQRGRSRSRSRSDSRGSMSSYDSYDDRSRSHARHHERRQRSPRDGSRHYNDRGGRFDDRDRDREDRRPPPQPVARDQPRGGPQWNTQNTPNRANQAGRGNQYPPNPPQPYGQPPFNAPSFPPQPPLPGQFPGQFPGQHFPPPPMPPFQGPGGLPAGIPPPPPPNFGGQFPPMPPNVAAMPNNNYNMNNQFGNGYGNNFGYGNNQGNFQGGNNYNNRGGYSDGRGGHGGSQRGGQRGGRWN
jgi:hypothetical protein